jgi:bifunctional non-homologous end joining protein LigD
MKDSIAALHVQDVIIGEIVALDEKGHSSFQSLQGFDMGEARPPIFYYAFDLLQLNGKNLQFTDRRTEGKAGKGRLERSCALCTGNRQP